MISRHFSLAVAAAFLLANSVAQAKEVSVPVDAKSGPWTVKANPKMKYGLGDNAAPVYISGFPLDSGAKMEIYADGTTTVTGKTVGALGFEDQEVNDEKGPRGKYYPSFYTPKLLYPAYAHALVGVFIDANDVIVGRPFVVGEGVRVPIPDGAVKLALGYNDVSFAGNSGSLTVTVNMPDE